MQLLGSSGAVLQQSTNTGTLAEAVNLTDVSAGVYYIRVFAASSTSSGTGGAHYTLALQAPKNAKTDLLWRNYSSGENILWTMNGITRVSLAYLTTVADPQWQLEGSADFTGDGQADLVWRNQATGQNIVWQMNGTTLVTAMTITAQPDTHWQIASVDDFDGDGQADLVWRNQTTGANQVWRMQGLSLVSTLTLPSVNDPQWLLVGSGDFNRDGQTDLVWRRQATGENVVWFMQGTTTLSTVYLPPVADVNWRIDGVGDLNGDDQPDLIWRNYNSGDDIVWFMQGTTLLSGTWVYFSPVADANWHIAAPLVVYGATSLVDLGGQTTATAFDLGTLNGQATYHSTIGSNGGSDYYRLRLTATDPAVYLQTSTGSLDLLSNTGTVLQSAVSTGAPVHIQRALDAGSYYLRVYGTTSYALAVFDTTAPPTITTSLVQDTARRGTDTDHRTADPTVSVQVGTAHWLGSLTAGFNTADPASFLPLTALALGSRFTLTPTQLQQINGGLALTDGSYVLHLRATGVFDVTAVTTDLAFTLDTTTSAPSGLRLTTGTGNTTNVTTPTVAGQAEAGALVQVYGAGHVLLGQGVADNSGSWQATLVALADGNYQVTAIATDVAGNVSLASNPLTLTIATSLTAPTNLALTTASDQGVSSTDGITKVTAPVLQGKAKPGATVKVYKATNVLLGQGTVDSAGNWQATLNTLADGRYTLQAIASDLAGNVSPAATLDVTIDTTAPVVVLDTNTAVVLTQQARLSGYVDGTGSGVVSAQYHFDNLAPVALTLDAYGDFDQAFDWTGISNGAHTLTLTTTDVAGNALTQTTAVTVNQGLTAPTLTAALAHDTGWDDTDGVTADPQVTGTLTGGNTSAHLQVGLDGMAAANFTTVALGSAGTFTVDRALFNTLAGGTLADGNHTLHLQARDASGNLLSVADVGLTLDTTAPTLTVTTPLTTTPLGNGTRLAGTVNGTGSAVVALQYQFDNLAPLPLSLDTTGNFNEWLDFTGIADGAHTLTVSSTDGAGNVTASHFNVTVQKGGTGGTASSNFLTVALAADTGTNTTDGLTSNPTVTGTVSAQVAKLLVGFDATPLAQFTAVTPGSNGSLTLDAAALATIYGDSLPDGAHTLRFQMLDAQGTVLGVTHVSFKLDTTAPDLRLPTLIDGIAWSPGEVLQGTLNEANPGAVLVYNFDGGTNTTLSLDTAGGFDTVLQTLPTQPAAHTLNLLATDSAGNLQNVAYHFLIADEQPVVDTDTLGNTTPPADPKPPSGTTFVDKGKIGAAGGSDGGWGFVGADGIWGFGGGSGSGSGGGWSPSHFGGFTPSSPITPGTGTPNPTDLNYIEGAGYHLDYVTAIHTLLDYAEGALSNDASTVNKKAALKNRLDVLNDIAQLINANPGAATLHDELAAVMHGIFGEVPLAGITKGEAVKDGYLLAQDIAKDTTAVTIQVYQAELLLTVDKVLQQKSVTTTAAQQTALATALKELATTYAKLNPTVADDASTTTTPNFLDSLWRAQLPINNQPRSGNEIAADLVLGETALTTLLTGVNNPVQAIQFMDNLLQAATKVVGLQSDLHDAKFIRELVNFGFEYAKLNPTGTASFNGDALHAFFDMLWQGVPDQQTRQVQEGLNVFFDSLNTENQRLKLLSFEDNLLKADRQVQTAALQDQKYDADFIGELVELGSAYAVLNHDSSSSADESSHFFLNTLWAATNEQGVQLGSQQLGDYFTSPIDMTDPPDGFNRAISNSLMNTTNGTLFAGAPSRLLTPRRDLNSSGRSLTSQEIAYARSIFGNSIDYSKIRIVREQIYTKSSTAAGVTIGNTIDLNTTYGSGNFVFQGDSLSLTPTGLVLLIHEMTHVWQYQHGGVQYAIDSITAQATLGKEAYNWQKAIVAGIPWAKWNPEQQARAVEEYNLHLRIIQSGKGSSIDYQLVSELKPFIKLVQSGQGAPTGSDPFENLKD